MFSLIAIISDKGKSLVSPILKQSLTQSSDKINCTIVKWSLENNCSEKKLTSKRFTNMHSILQLQVYVPMTQNKCANKMDFG